MPPTSPHRWDGRLTTHARNVAVFVAVATSLVGLLVVVIAFDRGESLTDGASGPLLDAWVLAVTVAIAAGLAVVAWRARSLGLLVFAAVFVLVAVQDIVAWHGEAAAEVVTRLDLSALNSIVDVGERVWAEFLVLLVIAVVGAGLILLAGRHRVPTRPVLVLASLLGLLFVFAAVADLAVAAYPDAGLGWVEEIGELLVLSLTLGYVAGLVALDPDWYTD